MFYLDFKNNQFCPSYPECLTETQLGQQDTNHCEQLYNDNQITPEDYQLYDAFPNPFNPITTITYFLPEISSVRLTIYDLRGYRVKELVNDIKYSGKNLVQWNATNDRGIPVSAGVYLYKIQTENFVDTKKMILLK